MIFSAIVMLDGGFGLVEGLLADMAPPRDRSRPDALGCFRGLTGFDVDLRTLNPILKGAGEEAADDVAVAEEATVEDCEGPCAA